jgi:hypothetical protein
LADFFLRGRSNLLRRGDQLQRKVDASLVTPRCFQLMRQAATARNIYIGLNPAFQAAALSAEIFTGISRGFAFSALGRDSLRTP